jgi:hypothetical protein
LLTTELSEARQQQMVTAEISKTISRSTFDLSAASNALVPAAWRPAAAGVNAGTPCANRFMTLIHESVLALRLQITS